MLKEHIVTGRSMSFFLEPGDRVTVDYSDKTLKTGDLGLFMRWRGGNPSLFIHRYWGKSGSGKKWLKGDARFSFDKEEDIAVLGKVVRLSNGKDEYDLSRQKFPFARSIVSFLLSKAHFGLFLFFRRAFSFFPLLFAGRLIPSALNRLSLELCVFMSSRFPAAARKILLAGIPRSECPQAARRGVKTGIIGKSEIWEGKIFIRDNVIIPRGVKVSLKAGSEIVFAEKPEWFFPLFGSGTRRIREADNSRTRIAVFGDLSFERGVFTIRGPGEIHYVSERRTFRGVSFSGKGKFLHFWNSAGKFENCSFLDFASALNFGPFSAGKIYETSFRNNSVSVSCEDFSDIRCGKSSFFGCGTAFSASGKSLLSLKNSAFSGNGTAVRAFSAPALSAEECSFSENGISCEIRGRVRASFLSCGFSGNENGILAEDAAALSVRNSEFSGNGNSLVKTEGKAKIFSFGSFYESEKRLIGHIGKNSSFCSFSDTFRSGGDAFHSAGKCSFKKADIRAVSCALKLLSGSAYMENCRVSAGNAAILEKDSSLILSSCRFSAGKSALVMDEAECKIRNSEFESDYACILARGGKLDAKNAEIKAPEFSALSISGSTEFKGKNLKLNGGEYIVPRPRRRGIYRKIRNFAAETSGLPGFSLAYYFYYKAAVYLFPRAVAFPFTDSVFLHRSAALGDAVFGISDIDFHVVLSGDFGGRDGIMKLSGAVKRMKRIFPVIGETLVSERKDFERFIRLGGGKGKEFSEKAIPLLKKGKKELPSDVKPSFPADFSEALHSYSILSRAVFENAWPRRTSVRAASRSFSNIMKYLGMSCAAADGNPEKMLYDSFRAISSVSSKICRTGAELREKNLQRRPMKGAARGEAEEVFSLLRKDWGGDLSFVLETFYRWYIIPAGAAIGFDSFVRLLSLIKSAREKYLFLAPLPVILDAPSHALLCSSAYLNDPFRHLLFGKDPGPFSLLSERADKNFVYKSGDSLFRNVPEDFAKKSALWAFAHFAASWIYSAPLNPAHYAYTRAAGFYLYFRRGEKLPFSDIDGLLGRLEKESIFPEPPRSEFNSPYSHERDYDFIAGIIEEAESCVDWKS